MILNQVILGLMIQNNIMPKIATIKNFSGMDENGIYYVENFVARKVNGKSVLSPGFGNRYIGSETEFSDFEVFSSMVPYDIGGLGEVFAKDSVGRIFYIDLDQYSTKRAKIHTTTFSGIINPVSLSDLFLTSNNNLLYPTAGTLGIAYIGRALSGSGATKIIDKDARNFTELGISTSTGYNKVYNITQGEEYTITSISTTRSTNDTLNFDAGTKTTATNDYFIVFADGGKDNGGNKWNFFTTTALPSFIASSSSIKRQIRQFDTDYLILNGNFIAALNEDETTWNDNFKQLPPNTEALCFEVNQDRILIGCNYRDKGRLLLWDGFSDGFLSIIETERPVTSIANSDTGFIFSMGNSLYLTNGYSIKKITQLPNTRTINNIVSNFNDLKTIEEKIFVLARGNDVNFTPPGMYLYEMGKGWSALPLANSSTAHTFPAGLGGIFPFPESSTYRIFSSFSDSASTNKKCINVISELFPTDASLIFRMPFDDYKNIKQIGLHLAPSFQLDRTDKNNVDVTLNIGTGKGFLASRMQAYTGSTTTTIKNNQGNLNGRAGVIGREIRVYNGDAGGERSYITEIANAGTNTETWTISPALSSAPTDGTEIRMYNLKKVDTKTVDPDNIQEQLVFDVRGIYTDELVFEVVMNGVSTGEVNLDILSIDIYD